MFSKKWRLAFRIFCSILFALGALFTILFVAALCIQSSITMNVEEFQKEGNYSKETMMLFADVAFPYDRIRKWDEDIKVEIVYTDKLNESLILEIDSIIAILSPLIHPVKIYKVPENGNLKVYRKVDSIIESNGKEIATRGFCYIPPLIKTLSWDIKYAEVSDIWYCNCIFHEILHAIGLQHSLYPYPFYMNMSGTYIFDSYEEMEEKLYNPLYISEEEKLIIKMLYSPHIKSGLKKKKFLKLMNLNDYNR
ncbi:MAG: DUF2927 domain-containing protein [Dysgonamonadaceae bacterium]|nr:DUF2927 domain-containing protein [Dysgonamonadaceae bacterium]